MNPSRLCLAALLCFAPLAMTPARHATPQNAPSQNAPVRNTTPPTADAAPAPRKRAPIFRATKNQITGAQTMLKERGLYAGDATGKLDQSTRDALKKFQTAEGLKATGTLNRVTLEKMEIELTERQRAM